MIPTKFSFILEKSIAWIIYENAKEGNQTTENVLRSNKIFNLDN